ncbi:MAG: serine/threonine-protein kinase [Planctomycetota bacterium]
MIRERGDFRGEDDLPGRSGEPLSVEVEQRVQDVAEEYLVALQIGAAPSVPEVVRAHPDIAGVLEARLKLMVWLHESSGDGSSSTLLTPAQPVVMCPHCGAEVDPRSVASGPVRCSCGGQFLFDRGSSGFTTIEADLSRICGARFEVEKVLGKGAFGIVFLARDLDLDREVALKIPRSGVDDDPQFRERFLREARSAAALLHPGIVQIFEVIPDPNRPVIVREYVEGTTLGELEPGERLDLRSAAKIIAQVADALDYANRKGVIHRDIKPANIIVDDDRQPRLMDFGLARRTERDVTMTLDGEVLGTPAYMSPEQARGDHEEVDGRSDVYALGVTLYELITEERPFTGQRNMVIQQVIYDEPRPPRRLNGRIPRDLETICLKAMEKRPDRRYETAGDFAEDLRRFLAREPIKARPVGRAERLVRWCVAKPALASLASAVVLLLVAVAVVSSLSAVKEREARHSATRQIARMHGSTGAQHFEAGELLESLPYLVESLRLQQQEGLDETVTRVRVQSVLSRLPRLVQVFGTGNVIRDVRFSPDSRHLAVMGDNDSAHIVNVETGEEVASLEHGGLVYSAQFSKDGETLLTACFDGSARAWAWRTGKERVRYPHGDRLTQAVYSPDESMIATNRGSGDIKLWSADGKFLRSLKFKTWKFCFDPLVMQAAWMHKA